MGRILLSNNSFWIDSLNKKFLNSGFNHNYEMDDIIVYDKLNVHVSNFVKIDDSAIFCNGTFVYKNMIGEDALRALYIDFRNNDRKIDFVRRDCFGSYFVVIKEKNSTTAFTDESGTYAIFYYADDKGDYLVTNTYYHVASQTGQKLNVLANIEEQLEFCLIDNETPFENVYRLLGNEAIIINNDGFNIERVEQNHYCLQNLDFDKVAVEIKDAIVSNTEKMKLFSENPIIFMTGGVDSRLSLASYLAASMSPTLCSWGGSHIKMHTKDQDVEVSKEIAEVKKLQFIEMDLSEDNPYSITDISREQFEKYGEWATIYGNNKKWFAFFEKRDDCFYEFGYFGETIKGWELLDRISKKYLTAEEFCILYTGRQSYFFDSQSKIDLNKYRERIHNKIKKIISIYEMDPKKLSKEDCMVLYFTYRLHADTKCCNFANIFGFCAPVLAHKPVADLINQCPYVYKQHDKINLYITKLIDQKLLDVQYFTHGKYMILDKDTLTLNYLKSDLRKQRLIEFSKKLHIHSLLKAIKRKVKGNNSHQTQMLIQYANRINNYSFTKESGIVVSGKSFDYPPMAIAMLAQCQMIDNVIKVQ